MIPVFFKCDTRFLKSDTVFFIKYRRNRKFETWDFSTYPHVRLLVGSLVGRSVCQDFLKVGNGLGLHTTYIPGRKAMATMLHSDYYIILQI